MAPDDHDLGEKRHWLMRAKLRVPRQQVSLVSRPRLTSILDEALGCGLVLVVAPAGFGKTTLLAQWRESAQETGTRVSWVTLDEGDADARQFIAYMVFALAEAGVDMASLEMIAEQGASDINPAIFLASVMDQVSKHSQRIVLVLDDYHRLDCEDIDDLINRVVADGPQNLTLVINSRTLPNLNLPLFMASGRASEIGAELLRFSRDETRAAVDVEIEDATLDALFERTEGWAVAVQLARLLVLGDPGNTGEISKFHGHQGHVATYLTDQVVEKLAPEVQDFLIKTSILERFNAPLADAVRHAEDGWEILRRLEPLHALLVPLEDESEWFRYHHLFADCLQDLLRRRGSAAEINELHLRASAWLEKEGYVSEAVRHARLAGDLEKCSRLIEEAGGWELILFGGIGYLRNLLRNIPERELHRFPRMQVARSYLALKDGENRLARAYFDAADGNPLGKERETLDRPGFGRDLLNVRVLLDSYEDRLNLPGMLDRYKDFAGKASADDGVTHGVIHCVCVMHHLANGNFDLAEVECREAMRSMRMANTVLGLNYAYLHAGLSAFYQGKFQLAEANFWEAQRMAEDNFGADSGLRSLANILLSALFFWRGGLADKEERSQFAASVDYVERYDGWLDIYATVLDVHTFGAFASQSFEDCRDAVERVAGIADERGIERLKPLVDAHRLLTGFGCGEKEALRLAPQIEAEFPIGCWKQNRFYWRGYQVAGQALALHYEAIDRSKAIAIAKDMIDCGAAMGAHFHSIQALILRATLQDRAGAREAGLADLLRALELAAPEKIRQPFLIHRQIAPLLRAALKYGRSKAVDTLTQSFIGECLELLKIRLATTSPEQAAIFSPRELEVLEELVQNLSNKEIARALDMTEHTVKFHLKNIFKKLGVDRRAQAIESARLRNIIT